MNVFVDALTGAAQEVLVSVLLAALSLASVYALTLIAKAKKRLQDQSDAEIIDSIIGRAAALAESTVLALESTVAKQLREAIKDGHATREELEALGPQAVEDVLNHLGPAAAELLDETMGDAQDFVRDLVEANVEKLKQDVIKQAVSPNSSSSAGS